MDEEGNFSPSISFKFNIPDNYDPNIEYKLKLANLELFKFNGNTFDPEDGREVIFAWPPDPRLANYMEMIQEGEIQLNISEADAQQTGGRKKNIKRKSHKRKSHKLKSHKRKSHKLKSKRKKSKSKRR